MARTTNIDQVEAARFDDAVQMHINEIKPWRRAPMAEKPRLYHGSGNKHLSTHAVAFLLAFARRFEHCLPQQRWQRGPG